jgi:hypothetical protein
MLALIGLVAISAEVSRDPRNSQNDFLGKIHSHRRVRGRLGSLKNGKNGVFTVFRLNLSPAVGLQI